MEESGKSKVQKYVSLIINETEKQRNIWGTGTFVGMLLINFRHETTYDSWTEQHLTKSIF